MQRQISAARLQQTHDLGVAISESIEGAAERAAGHIGAPQALANPILAGPFFTLGPHRYVYVAKVIALFEIAAKYADLAYTFQQFGPSIHAFNALQESCNYDIGLLPR